MDREGGVILFASLGPPIIVTAASHALIHAKDMWKEEIMSSIIQLSGMIDGSLTLYCVNIQPLVKDSNLPRILKDCVIRKN